MKTFKNWFIGIFMLVLSMSNIQGADMCYDPPVSSGGILCLGIFDIGGCKLTTPMRNISSSALTDVTVIKAYQGIDLSLMSGIGIDGTSQTPNIDGDNAEVTNSLNQYTNFNGFVDFNIFNKGVVYRTNDYAPSTSSSTADQHTIYTQSLIGFSFSSVKYIAEYTKDGVDYNTRIYPCGEKLVSLTPQKQSIIEGNSGTTAANFTVTLSETPTSGKVIINYTITAGTATQGTDYSATSYSGQLTFNKNTPTLAQTIPTSVIGDLSLENNETYTVELTSLATASGFVIDESFQKGTVTIVDDDLLPPPVIGWEQAAYETAENTTLPYGGASQMPMRIVLDHEVDYPISVTYQTYNGTAIGDVDYRIAGGTVTIPAHTTSLTVNMDIYHDEAIELAENFTVILSNPIGSGGVSLVANRTTAPVTITEQNTAPMCYSDNFNVALDDKWRTLVALGGFTPQISSGHLKLTPGKKNISTAVTKDYEFPSKENLIIVEFQHYAYGGCFEESPAEAGLGDYGADGIVAVLYDSAVGATPTVGGYGGSMGYAQRTDNVANGFQGGWLGLGLDEYGNFANPTEGRVGGPGFHTNAAVIRGDGVGTTGYEFLAEAYPLATPIAPAVDFHNPAKLPGDKFRLTVDARDTAHLYIRLERDTGSGYVTIINGFDAKNPVYNQTTTPDMVRFALTAGTGGGCNAHEIDELTVWGRCTPYNPNPPIPPANTGAVDVVDNYPLDGYTAQTGLKTKITSQPLKTIDAVWLGTAGGSTAIPYYTAGNNKVLDMPVLFYVSDIDNTDDNGMCTTERYQLMGSNGSPLVATFHAGDTYARSSSTYTVQAAAKKHSKILTKYINFYGMNLIDPSITCLVNSSNSANIAGMPQCVNSENQYKQAFGQAAVNQCRSTLNGAPCEPNNHGIGAGVYNHAYGCYQCTLDALATKGCSSDAFAIRPEKFEIVSTHYDWANILRAGEEYNTKISAYDFATANLTQGYNVLNANAVFAFATKKYNNIGAIDVTMMGIASFGGVDFNMTNGISTKEGAGVNEVAGISFDNVGKINLSVEDQTWSEIDNDDTLMDCTVGGTYICGNVDVTFIPHHFDFNTLTLTNNNGNPGSFTYIANEVAQMSGRIDTQMRALNKAGGVTTNFATAPLWENPVTVVPVVIQPTYLHPNAIETTIAAQTIGFGTGADAKGTKTVPWNEVDATKYLRFNFQRDINLPQNSFDIIGTNLDISVKSNYADPNTGHTAIVQGSRLGAGVADPLTSTVVLPANGTSTFVYGRIIPRDIRVFGAVIPVTANAWYEVFNTPIIGIIGLSASRNGSPWFINALHSDTVANYDGNAEVTYVNTTLQNPAIGGAVGIDGMEDYIFAAMAIGGYKAHINTDPWLWYGVNVLPYADPGINVDGTVDAAITADDCLNHPCFNINVVNNIGRAGSATSEALKDEKTNKESQQPAGIRYDYTPTIR